MFLYYSNTNIVGAQTLMGTAHTAKIADQVHNLRTQTTPTSLMVGSILNSQQRGADTKRKESALLIVAALLKNAKIDASERGTAERIREMLEHVGVKLHSTTISSLLAEIPSLLEKKT